MAVWQVDLHIVPKRALSGTAQRFDSATLGATEWWAADRFAPDYRVQLGAIGASAPADAVGMEAWGPAEGNRVEVESVGGRVRRVIARVDVRRLDSKFSATVLLFARAADAVFIRSDGMIVEPTISAYTAALRTAPAWKYATDIGAMIAAADGVDDGADDE